MSHYQTGLSVPSFYVPRFVSDQTKALSMMWQGAGKGKSVRSRYQDGIRGHGSRVAGETTNSIITTMMDLMHVLLIVGGAWLFVNALINL